jgi:hypothetical protein
MFISYEFVDKDRFVQSDGTDMGRKLTADGCFRRHKTKRLDQYAKPAVDCGRHMPFRAFVRDSFRDTALMNTVNELMAEGHKPYSFETLEQFVERVTNG